MTRPLFRLSLVMLIASVLLGGGPFAAEQDKGDATAGRGNGQAFPRLADGKPDLEGFWTNDTYTPLERPVELGDKEFFTYDEAVAFVKRQTERLLAQPKDNIHYDDAIWQAENYSKQENLRTSLLVEPRNGRLPPLTPEAQRRLPHQRATQRGASSDSAQSRSLGERCLSWGNVGPPMIPPAYFANLQNCAGIRSGAHSARADERCAHHLSGRALASRAAPQLARRSFSWPVGRTDLVVDTTNFTERTNFRGSAPIARQDIFATQQVRVQSG